MGCVTKSNFGEDITMKLVITQRFIISFLILTISLFVGLGCSEADDRVSSACELISTEKVNEIFGVTFDEAKETQHRENGDIFVSMCSFSSSDPNSLSSCSVLVLYNPALKNPKVDVEDHIKSFREGIGDPNYAFESINDLGEAALYDSAMKQLTVFEKGRMTIYQAFGKDPKSQLVDMARAVLSK